MTHDGRPHPNTYWIDDGRLMAGEYPLEMEAGDERLCSYLDCRVSVFIDLTEEHELYPYREALLEHAAARGMTVRHERHPIRDVSIPEDRERMVRILDAIDQALGDGEVVYVHCWGGTGRTGTVAGCWFVERGMSGEDALGEVARRWGTMEKAPHRPWGSPETEEQREYVRGWRRRTERQEIA